MKKLFLSLVAFFWFFGELAFASPIKIAPNEQPKPTSDAVTPVAISTPAAPYPNKLIRKCIGGDVRFKFTILENGSIGEVVILESPSDKLSSLVIDTVRKKWRFTTYSAAALGRFATYQSHMSFVVMC